MDRQSDKPVIGITVSRKKSKIARFFDWFAVWQAGGVARFVEPGAPYDRTSFDGLIIGGGDDISAELYHGEITPDIRIDPQRDALELELLEFVIKNETFPVLGICRGAQIMNVFLGGTLYQDIRGMPREKTNIRTVLARKIVTFTPGSRLQEIFEREEIRVNSLHHQAIDKLGTNLKIVGQDRGGFVQAVEHTGTRFFYGVQWHPEFLVFDKGQRRLFHALVNQAKARRRRRA